MVLVFAGAWARLEGSGGLGRWLGEWLALQGRVGNVVGQQVSVQAMPQRSAQNRGKMGRTVGRSGVPVSRAVALLYERVFALPSSYGRLVSGRSLISGHMRAGSGSARDGE